jgi:hypothetical protein
MDRARLAGRTDASSALVSLKRYVEHSGGAVEASLSRHVVSSQPIDADAATVASESTESEDDDESSVGSSTAGAMPVSRRPRAAVVATGLADVPLEDGATVVSDGESEVPSPVTRWAQEGVIDDCATVVSDGESEAPSPVSRWVHEGAARAAPPEAVPWSEGIFDQRQLFLQRRRRPKASPSVMRNVRAQQEDAIRAQIMEEMAKKEAAARIASARKHYSRVNSTPRSSKQRRRPKGFRHDVEGAKTKTMKRSPSAGPGAGPSSSSQGTAAEDPMQFLTEYTRHQTLLDEAGEAGFAHATPEGAHATPARCDSAAASSPTSS